MGLGKEANGMGLLVQGGKVVDLEKGLGGNRGAWMGAEMSRMYSEGIRGTAGVFLELAEMLRGKL